jgi:hypothetical protein
MKHFAFFLLVVLFSGCVTEKKCRERFPFETETFFKDTLIVTSTRSFDTLIQDVGTDTVYIRDLKTRIETKLVKVNDSIFVSTKCPSDTIRVEKVVQTITNKPSKETNWFFVVLAIILTTIVFLSYSIFMKLR